MPLLLIFPAMIFFATMAVMGQAAMQTFPVAPATPTAGRRAFKVIEGGAFEAKESA